MLGLTQVSKSLLIKTKGGTTGKSVAMSILKSFALFGSISYKNIVHGKVIFEIVKQDCEKQIQQGNAQTPRLVTCICKRNKMRIQLM